MIEGFDFVVVSVVASVVVISVVVEVVLVVVRGRKGLKFLGGLLYLGLKFEG